MLLTLTHMLSHSIMCIATITTASATTAETLAMHV